MEALDIPISEQHYVALANAHAMHAKTTRQRHMGRTMHPQVSPVDLPSHVHVAT